MENLFTDPELKVSEFYIIFLFDQYNSKAFTIVSLVCGVNTARLVVQLLRLKIMSKIHSQTSLVFYLLKQT